MQTMYNASMTPEFLTKRVILAYIFESWLNAGHVIYIGSTCQEGCDFVEMLAQYEITYVIDMI